MRNTITRTITTADIHTATIRMENGEIKAIANPTITAYGNIDTETAQKIARKKYGKNANVVVLEVVHIDNEYEISVEDFIKYATKIEK